jgi:dsDNA-binding SOS-regulon protein
MWKCDRDDAMFDNKKDADAHDRMLELAENLSALLEKQIHGSLPARTLQ